MASLPSAAVPISLPTKRTELFDPPFELARLRDEQPLRRVLHRDGKVGWLVTNHALARVVLTDPRLVGTTQERDATARSATPIGWLKFGERVTKSGIRRCGVSSR